MMYTKEKYYPVINDVISETDSFPDSDTLTEKKIGLHLEVSVSRDKVVEAMRNKEYDGRTGCLFFIQAVEDKIIRKKKGLDHYGNPIVETQWMVKDPTEAGLESRLSNGWGIDIEEFRDKSHTIPRSYDPRYVCERINNFDKSTLPDCTGQTNTWVEYTPSSINLPKITFGDEPSVPVKSRFRYDGETNFCLGLFFDHPDNGLVPIGKFLTWGYKLECLNKESGWSQKLYSHKITRKEVNEVESCQGFRDAVSAWNAHIARHEEAPKITIHI